MHLVFLLEVVVANLGEKLVLELGPSTLCVVNLTPKTLVMRLTTIRLYHSWYLVSVTIEATQYYNTL